MRSVNILILVSDDATRATHLLSCPPAVLRLCCDNGLNVGRQAIYPQGAEEIWRHCWAGDNAEVAEELRWTPVTHLLVH